MKAVRLMKTGFIRDGTSNSRSDRHHFIIIQRKKNVRNPPGCCCFNGASMIGMERFFFFCFFLTLPVWGVGWADGEWKSKEERKKKERYFFKKTSKDPVCPLRSSRIGLGRVPDVRLSRCGWSRGVAVLIKRSTLSLSLSLSLFRSSPIYLSLSYLRLLMRRSIRQ